MGMFKTRGGFAHDREMTPSIQLKIIWLDRRTTCTGFNCLHNFSSTHETQIQQDRSVAAAAHCLYRFIRHRSTLQQHTYSFSVIVDASVLLQLIPYLHILLW